MTSALGDRIEPETRVWWRATLVYRPYVIAVVAVALVLFILPAPSGTNGTGLSASGGTAGGAGGSSGGTVGAAGGATTGLTPGAAGGATVDSAGAPVGGTDASGGVAAGVVAAPGAYVPNSAEALANPNCDAALGRMKIHLLMAAPCMPAWPAGADNGGATAQGVTPEAIKVVYLSPSTTSSAQPDSDCYMNFRDISQMYQRFYVTYGRTVEVTQVIASGDSETNQRADAVKVAALEPFAVITCSSDGGAVFQTEAAKRGIMVFGLNNTVEASQAQAPFRWGFNTGIEGLYLNVAEFVGKALAGRPAKFAGNPLMQTQPRKFGAVVPDTIPDSYLIDALKVYGVTPVVIHYSYKGASGLLGDPDSYQTDAPIIAAKLQDEGVNNVIAFTDLLMTASLTRQATAQAYFPEWTVTGFQYQDNDLLARTFDQQQWIHAFGVGVGYPRVSCCRAGTFHRLYYWYFGDSIDNYTTGIGSYAADWLFNGIHLAGPNLTPYTFRDAIFTKLPPSRGSACGCVGDAQTSWGEHGFFPWPDYIMWDDFTLVYWDPDEVGDSNYGTDFAAAPGKYRYLFGAKRFLLGTWPEGELPFFQDSQSPANLPEVPASDRVPDYPCEGCPSQGG